MEIDEKSMKEYYNKMDKKAVETEIDFTNLFIIIKKKKETHKL